MNERNPFGYVVSIDGSSIRLNLLDAHRGQVASHRDGVTGVTEIGGLFAVGGGSRLLVLRVRSLSFAEPREAHRAGVGSTSGPTATAGEPLRHLDATVIGTISRSDGRLLFNADSLASPVLGAEAFPLQRAEAACILSREMDSGARVNLGADTRGGGNLLTGLSQLLGRHVAVLGSTGQGKSCLTAAVLQQMLSLPSPRIVVFDINGEYESALRPHVAAADGFKKTILGGTAATRKIPYFALGRHGLSRLFLPSEKTQRPALAFALENLSFVRTFADQEGAGLADEDSPTLFDDGRIGDASPAQDAITQLRSRTANPAAEWPHMNALATLVAEGHSIKQSRSGGWERDGFHYGNVSPLVTRIRRCVEDPLFTSVVDVGGGPSTLDGPLDWNAEGTALCEEFFGGPGVPWKVHLVDLRNVAHDLMPLVLGSLLELLAFELFKRGQDGSYPTLLVLEEAHHYLRQFVEPGEGSALNNLAYERLAKEGRKFGLSLWISTQRPSEVSPTVLSQCGTWAVFRLTSEQDLKAVAAAGEWADRQQLAQIAGLPRQQALIFGASMTIPVRVVTPDAVPPPKSSDPNFERWEAGPPVDLRGPRKKTTKIK